MTFDPKIFAALWYARQLFPESVPEFASSALEAGFDGPALRRLAGLIRPTSVDVDPLLETALTEIGCTKPLSSEQALIELGRQVARQIVEGTVAPFEGCRILAAYAMSAGYPPGLSDFFQLYDESNWGEYGRNGNALEAAIIEEAHKFLNQL